MVILLDTKMFNLFKKKKTKNIQEWEYELLEVVVKKLPSKYSFLINQINSNCILDSVPNELLMKNWKRIIWNQKLYDSLKNKSINYKLINIKVFDLESKDYKRIHLDLYEGILIGYRLDNNSGNLDFENITIDDLQEELYQDKKEKEIHEIWGDIPSDLAAVLDLDDTYKIEIPEGEFYIIKDLGNGNYLSIDQGGAIYGMVHDPYEIEKLFEDKHLFFEALKSKEFHLQEYINKKMS